MSAKAVDLDLDKPGLVEQELREANDLLGRERKVPREVVELVLKVGDSVLNLPDKAIYGIDPYLVVALQHGALGSLRALQEPSAEVQRKRLRVALEQLRQALRDMGEGGPVQEDRPPKEIVRWMVRVLDVPQRELAELLSVSPRTFQRWLSPDDRAQPRGEETIRVRTLARIVSNLRHVLSGPGVVHWFRKPHPYLGGKRPISLLVKPEAANDLMRLASSVRSSGAT